MTTRSLHVAQAFVVLALALEITSALAIAPGKTEPAAQI